jgi:hypothetical protein
MIENSVIIDAVNQEVRVTVVTEAPEAFVNRVKEGHLVKYAKNIHKKLHLPHNIEVTHDGDLKVSVYFKKPLSIGGIVSVTAAISDMANVVIDSVMAAPRFNAAINYLNGIEPKKLEKHEESDESNEDEEE